MACNVNCRTESEGLLKVTGSHVHCSSNVSETETVLFYRPLTESYIWPIKSHHFQWPWRSFQWPWRSFTYCMPF